MDMLNQYWSRSSDRSLVVAASGGALLAQDGSRDVLVPVKLEAHDLVYKRKTAERLDRNLWSGLAGLWETDRLDGRRRVPISGRQ